MHWPSRSTSVGDHAPVAITTTSAAHSVPSSANTPTHRFASLDSNGALKVPAVPKAVFTPKRRSSCPTESRAFRAATQPPCLTPNPRQSCTSAQSAQGHRYAPQYRRLQDGVASQPSLLCPLTTLPDDPCPRQRSHHTDLSGASPALARKWHRAICISVVS
jgi:hypothetical protein